MHHGGSYFLQATIRKPAHFIMTNDSMNDEPSIFFQSWALTIWPCELPLSHWRNTEYRKHYKKKSGTHHSYPETHFQLWWIHVHGEVGLGNMHIPPEPEHSTWIRQSSIKVWHCISPHWRKDQKYVKSRLVRWWWKFLVMRFGH